MVLKPSCVLNRLIQMVGVAGLHCVASHCSELRLKPAVITLHMGFTSGVFETVQLLRRPVFQTPLHKSNPQIWLPEHELHVMFIVHCSQEHLSPGQGCGHFNRDHDMKETFSCPQHQSRLR